jgi:peptidoglycan/LPS O-acetylase OafA/YrhL
MDYIHPSERKYFTEFDSLRFFAAQLTCFYHTILLKRQVGINALPDLFQSSWGTNAVTFFFVLSGFIITLLLVREKRETGNVDIRKFYLRRIFRIWPLYYLIIIVGLVVFPIVFSIKQQGSLFAGYDTLNTVDYLGYFSFLANLGKTGVLSNVLIISFTWSVSVEEQFYIFWPWVLKKLKKPIYGIASVALAFFLVRYVPYYILKSKDLHNYLMYFRFDCMAIGGIAAILFTSKIDWIDRYLTQRWALKSLAGVCIVLTLMPSFLSENYLVEIYSVFYGLLLLALGMQAHRVQWLNHPWLRHLGKISYGIYMYNGFACFFALKIAFRLGGNSWEPLAHRYSFVNIAYYLLATILTIGLAHLSYTYFETPFLKLKDRFGAVKTPAVHG